MNLAIGVALLLMLPRERSFEPGSGVRAVLAAMLAHLRRPDMLAACLVGSLILFAQVALFTYITLLLAGGPYDLRPGLLASVSAVYLLGMVTTPLAGSALRRFRESVPFVHRGRAVHCRNKLDAVGAAVGDRSGHGARFGRHLPQPIRGDQLRRGGGTGSALRGRGHLHELLLRRRQHRCGGTRCTVVRGRLAGGGRAVDRLQHPCNAHRGELLASAFSCVPVALRRSGWQPSGARFRCLLRAILTSGCGNLVIVSAGRNAQAQRAGRLSCKKEAAERRTGSASTLRLQWQMP